MAEEVEEKELNMSYGLDSTKRGKDRRCVRASVDSVDVSHGFTTILSSMNHPEQSYCIRGVSGSTIGFQPIGSGSIPDDCI